MLAGGKKEMAEHGAERDGAKRQSEQQSELSPGSGDLIDIGKRWVGFSPGKPKPPPPPISYHAFQLQLLCS